MTRRRAPAEWSYEHLDQVVVAFLQGRKDMDSAVEAIENTHSREQIQAILFNEGERYRRFNHGKFRDLVERLRSGGILW